MDIHKMHNYAYNGNGDACTDWWVDGGELQTTKGSDRGFHDSKGVFMKYLNYTINSVCIGVIIFALIGSFFFGATYRVAVSTEAFKMYVQTASLKQLSQTDVSGLDL